jgi:hypothetical protein
VQYALSPYIKHIRFVFKGLKILVRKYILFVLQAEFQITDINCGKMLKGWNRIHLQESRGEKECFKTYEKIY